jgi:hypothetical protein
MYRIAVFLYPDGKVQTSLQSSEKNGPSISALSFFSRVKGEVEKFKKSYQKCYEKGQ